MLKKLYILASVVFVCVWATSSEDIERMVKQINTASIPSPKEIPLGLLGLCYSKTTEDPDGIVMQAATAKVMEVCTQYPDLLLQRIASGNEAEKNWLKPVLQEVIINQGIFEKAYSFLSPYFKATEEKLGPDVYHFLICSDTKPEDIPDDLWVLKEILLKVIEKYKTQLTEDGLPEEIAENAKIKRIQRYCDDCLATQPELVRFMLTFIAHQNLDKLKPE